MCISRDPERQDIEGSFNSSISTSTNAPSHRIDHDLSSRSKDNIDIQWSLPEVIMADIKDLKPDLRKLENQLDHLEESLEPLMGNLQELSSQLPLLDKAKLFSLTAYSIESMLFGLYCLSICKDHMLISSVASLKLEGQDAQNHEVFTELKRIQQYFAKIKKVEEPRPESDRPSLTVNKEAAARILKSDLVRSHP